MASTLISTAPSDPVLLLLPLPPAPLRRPGAASPSAERIAIAAARAAVRAAADRRRVAA